MLWAWCSLFFVISFLMVLALVPFFRFIANHTGMLDAPDGHVKIHEGEVPCLGGAAVYVGTFISLPLIFTLFGASAYVLPLVFVVTTLFFVGLADDRWSLRPGQKFLGQCIAVAGYVWFVKDHLLFTTHGFWYLPVAAFCILSIVNAFNLIDVMDGLATISAIGASVSFLVMAIVFGCRQEALLLCAFLGSLCAFFLYNRPSASMYLGDAGSMFIGCFLATIHFPFKFSSASPWVYCVPLIVLAIPLLEVVMLIGLRMYKGIPFYLGSLDHFYMYLRRRGWSKNLILLYVFCMSCVLIALSLSFALGRISFSQTFCLSALFGLGWLTVTLYGCGTIVGE